MDPFEDRARYPRQVIAGVGMSVDGLLGPICEPATSTTTDIQPQLTNAPIQSSPAASQLPSPSNSPTTPTNAPASQSSALNLSPSINSQISSPSPSLSLDTGKASSLAVAPTANQTTLVTSPVVSTSPLAATTLGPAPFRPSTAINASGNDAVPSTAAIAAGVTLLGIALSIATFMRWRRRRRARQSPTVDTVFIPPTHRTRDSNDLGHLEAQTTQIGRPESSVDPSFAAAGALIAPWTLESPPTSRPPTRNSGPTRGTLVSLPSTRPVTARVTSGQFHHRPVTVESEHATVENFDHFDGQSIFNSGLIPADIPPLSPTSAAHAIYSHRS